MNWYSAMLATIVVVEGAATASRRRTVALLRAESFDDAFQIAISLGRREETQYKNRDGMAVTWIFERVESIDELGEQIAPGREVFTESAEVALADLLLPPTPETPTWDVTGV